MNSQWKNAAHLLRSPKNTQRLLEALARSYSSAPREMYLQMEDMSQYRPFIKKLEGATSSEELLDLIDEAIDEYDDLLETTRTTEAAGLVRATSYDLTFHLVKYFTTVETGLYPENLQKWGKEVAARSIKIVTRIASANRYSNDRFETDLKYRPYPARNHFTRKGFSAEYTDATQSNTVKKRVYDFLEALSKVRSEDLLPDLFDEQGLPIEDVS